MIVCTGGGRRRGGRSVCVPAGGGAIARGKRRVFEEVNVRVRNRKRRRRRRVED